MSSNRFVAAIAALTPRLLSFAALAALPFASVVEAAPAVSTVVAFSGSSPSGNLVLGLDGALYGTAATTTSVTGGLIFRVMPDGSSVKTIHQLARDSEGQVPQAGLLRASDDKFYGSTKYGKSGTLDTTGILFRLNEDGSGFEVLHRFAPYTETNVALSPKNDDGAYPTAELVEGSDGNLYGVTSAGGTNGAGVIFRIGKDGSGFVVLHTFGALTTASTDTLHKNADGMSASGPLVQAADGKFYGTAFGGGATGRGTVFRINFDGTGFEVLHTFTETTTNDTTKLLENADGAGPVAGLTDGNDGLLYGVTSQAGTNGYGTLFSIAPGDSTFTNLHDFDNAAGGRPASELALFSDGKLYGATLAGGTSSAGAATNFGTIFSVARDGTGFASLHSFDSISGAAPSSRLVELSSTLIAGSTTTGANCGSGSIYRYDATGGTITGDTKCGRKKNNSNGGGGATGPALVLLLGGLALARRRRR